MNGLRAFWKKLQLRQIVIVFFASFLLLVSTACSGANAQGANPQNPAVQAGGANNPYKSGGDKYTNYNLSTDNKVNNTKANKGDQASIQQSGQLLIATNDDPRILYPGAETPQGRAKKEAKLPIITEKDFRPKQGALIQRLPDVGDRLKERLGTVQEEVQEASDFLKDKADEASARPELKPSSARR
ncbi:hypothetical protein NIES4075_32130 [Tolypothrix sp. NIES-4075]|uniref:DUF6658 family protein n=1 Tax=Tolypothrix sp. NIES-4075 TaxID=2005459 RepID=UPI000B5CD279|nr:DUF6658 family protein [Tolypothrix sp. NIES-4075]GAX42213.1 hypothetical protein NIES4075_32130 [Tolypothrix sp. NIES-4075]